LLLLVPGGGGGVIIYYRNGGEGGAFNFLLCVRPGRVAVVIMLAGWLRE
jgi:hypothetical protein